MKRILAIAVIAIRSAIRSRVVLAVSALILTILVAGPLTVEGDGTVSGQMNITLRYTLTAVSFLMGLVTIWLGCASISMDVQQRHIHLLSTKPVRALELWMGKWLGLLAVNAGILVFTGILTLLMVTWAFHPSHFPQSVPAEEIAEIWRARSPSAPVYPSLKEKINQMVNERIDMIPANHRPARSELEEAAKSTLLKRLHTVTHQEEQQWTFPPTGQNKEKPIRLTYRLSASALGPVAVAGRWTVSQEGRATPWQHAVTNSSGRLVSLQIPADLFQPDLPLEFRYQNLARDASTVVFTPQDFRLYTYRHSMAWNLCKALLLVFFELAFLGAVGVTAGAVFSLPVAALVSGYIVLMLQADNYIQRMAHSDNLIEGSDGVLEQLMQILFFTLSKLMLLLQDQPALAWLAEGAWIDPRILVYDGLTKLVLYSGLIAGFGVYLYRRREIGLPS